MAVVNCDMLQSGSNCWLSSVFPSLSGSPPDSITPSKRKRGRPPGSKNKPKEEGIKEFSTVYKSVINAIHEFWGWRGGGGN